MSHIPPHWEEAPLGELGTEVRGSVSPASDRTYELYSVPTFPTGRPEIIEGSEIASSKRRVIPADLLLCKINPRINRVWMVADPTGEGEQIASTEYLVLRVSDPELTRYLMWYLRSPRFREWIKLSVEGATGSHTRAKSAPVLRQRVPIPPRDEQRRIVAAIEEHVSHLDAAEVMLSRTQALLARLRKAVLSLAAAGSWPVVRLSEVAEIVSGQTPKGLLALKQGPVPFYKVGDMNIAEGRVMTTSREYVDDEMVAARKLKIRPAGTIVFPKRGGAIATNKKRVLGVPAAFDLNTMGIIPSESLSSGYLLAWLETVDLNSLSDGSNVPQINHGDVEPLLIPLPPLDEQRRIVTEVERQLSLVESLASAIDTALARSGALRRTILERAFTGRLVPQDPSDEPASVLLERIKAERAKAEAATGRRPRRRATMETS